MAIPLRRKMRTSPGRKSASRTSQDMVLSIQKNGPAGRSDGGKATSPNRVATPDSSSS